MSKKKRDRDKEQEQEQDQELELPDSTKDEVFILQFLRKYGATPEEAIAFAKVHGNMLAALAQDIKADLRKELKAIRTELKSSNDSTDAKMKSQSRAYWTLAIIIGILTAVIGASQIWE